MNRYIDFFIGVYFPFPCLILCYMAYKIRFVYLDIDECADDTLNACHPRLAVCKNSMGSFGCKCIEGYTGDGRNCTGQ